MAVVALALRLVMGHARAMARPATPFRLTADQQAELRARLRQATMAPRLRIRLQAVQLRDQGQTVPLVAEQLAVSQATVRRALQRVRTGGLDALADRPRAGRPPQLSDHDLGAVEALLRQAARQGQTRGHSVGCQMDNAKAGRLRNKAVHRADFTTPRQRRGKKCA